MLSSWLLFIGFAFADCPDPVPSIRNAEKDAVWDKIREQIPMIYVYEDRTDRNIRVFRLSRVRGA